MKTKRIDVNFEQGETPNMSIMYLNGQAVTIKEFKLIVTANDPMTVQVEFYPNSISLNGIEVLNQFKKGD